MSEETWEKVRTTVNEIIQVINEAGEGLTVENNAVDFSQRVFDKMIELNRDPVGEALSMTKKEIQTIF